jgi:hypothetical protein
LAISCKWKKQKNTTENVKHGMKSKQPTLRLRKNGMNQRNRIPNIICVRVSAFMASTVTEL